VNLPQRRNKMIRFNAIPASLILIVAWAAFSSAADPEKDPTKNLRSLGARFIATGFHAGWAGDSKRLVYGSFPFESGLEIVDVTTRKGRELIHVGKDASWSPAKDGPIAYVLGNGEEEQVYLVDADGRNQRKLGTGGCPHWSPDGKTLYFSVPKDGKIMKWDVAKGGDPIEFCDFRRSWYPIVSPDAKQIAFVEQGQFVIVEAASGDLAHLHKLPSAAGGLVDWSFDGKWVAFGGYGGQDRVGLWLMNVEEKKVTQVDTGPFTQPVFSPDGAVLAVDLRVDAKRREVWMIETKKLHGLPFADLTKE
jgi:Tol biopolymer transport system component